MSFEAMKWAAEQTLPAMQKIVLMMLANRADKDGKCYPSHERLIVDCGMSKSSVIRNIEALESIGLIAVNREISNGIKSVNKYTLRIINSVTETLPSVTETLPSVTETLPSVTQTLGGSVTQTHEPVIIEPVIEPSFSSPLGESKKEISEPDSKVESEPTLTTEMQECHDWAIEDEFWKKSVTSISKFLILYTNNKPNGLKAQFQRHKEKRKGKGLSKFDVPQASDPNKLIRTQTKQSIF